MASKKPGRTDPYLFICPDHGDIANVPARVVTVLPRSTATQHYVAQVTCPRGGTHPTEHLIDDVTAAALINEGATWRVTPADEPVDLFEFATPAEPEPSIRIMRMRCPEHDVVEILATDIAVTSHPSGQVLATAPCPLGEHVLRVRIGRNRAVQLHEAGATWIVPDEQGGHTLPRRPIPPTQGIERTAPTPQLFDIELSDPARIWATLMTRSEVEDFATELANVACPSAHADSEQRVLDAQRRMGGQR